MNELVLTGFSAADVIAISHIGKLVLVRTYKHSRSVTESTTFKGVQLRKR